MEGRGCRCLKWTKFRKFILWAPKWGPALVELRGCLLPQPDEFPSFLSFLCSSRRGIIQLISYVTLVLMLLFSCAHPKNQSSSIPFSLCETWQLLYRSSEREIRADRWFQSEEIMIVSPMSFIDRHIPQRSNAHGGIV